MSNIEDLNNKIIRCRKCPRLVAYTRTVAKEKVRRYKDWNYWGKPLPGFGDVKAELLIIGLAPAAHGGNRTGRMFTGDSSGDWLMRALHETGFANQPTSEHKDDGLRLRNAYVTAILRCAPPDNKPAREEINNCSSYLERELELLQNVKVVLTLGSLAFNTYTSLRILKGLKFSHGSFQKVNGLTLVSSYHPSRQNTQTGRLKWDAWLDVFQKIRNMLN